MSLPIEDERLMDAALIEVKGMKLKEHIQTYHNGNQTSFARSQSVSQSQTGRWQKRNCVVPISGTVYCEVSKKLRKGRL